MILNSGDGLGKYVVIRFLGSGAFGPVYLMHDNLMNRDVAVKLVENKNPSAFVAHLEAQILNLCRDERIVAENSADAIHLPSGHIYAIIDMEFLAGGSI